ncbi:hypothetical protein BC830DRAFT_1081717 [Chytriomyces sp. MP71]|nr:hypothetical protein BC830DRAFT_1081717 [Chytriomyces sp. MP71]
MWILSAAFAADFALQLLQNLHEEWDLSLSSYKRLTLLPMEAPLPPTGSLFALNLNKIGDFGYPACGVGALLGWLTGVLAEKEFPQLLPTASALADVGKIPTALVKTQQQDGWMEVHDLPNLLQLEMHIVRGCNLQMVRIVLKLVTLLFILLHIDASIIRGTIIKEVVQRHPFLNKPSD